MEKAVKDFAQRQEHAYSDSTFVVIMSHGKRDAILGVHYNASSNPSDTFLTDKIYHCLNTENCPGLRDKPKVILIQACRGGTKMTEKIQLFIVFYIWGLIIIITTHLTCAVEKGLHILIQISFQESMDTCGPVTVSLMIQWM